MKARLKLIVTVAAIALAGGAAAQTATDSTRDTNRSAGEATRDSANAVGRAAGAAVTPGDQNMGRNPDNRSGGLMGNERSSTGSDTSSTGSDTSSTRRAARADRG